jgi:predicted aspartyl protease
MCINYLHWLKVITLVENYNLKLNAFLKQSEYSSVKLQRLKTNHIQIEAKINGVKGVFILDTGASNSCVDTKLGDFFKIQSSESSEKASSATSEISNTLISKNNNIKIGKWNNKKFQIVLFDMSYINKTLIEQGSKNVSGIIGSDLLKKGKGIIDYSSNRLFLKN